MRERPQAPGAAAGTLDSTGTFRPAVAALTAAVLGATLVYLLDPAEGRRRRARVRAELAHAAERAEGAAGSASRDLGQRARGAVADLRARFTPGAVSDDVLTDRVRARVEAVFGGPCAVRCAVENGRVTLSGPVLAEDVERLVRRVGAVRGVADVANELEVYAEPGNVPGLQGGRTGPRQAQVFQLSPEPWSFSLGALTATAMATTAIVLVATLTRRH